MIHLLVTILGRDQPTLVRDLEELAVHQDALWRDAQVTRIGGHLTGMALLEVPDDRLTPLVVALHAVPDVQVHTTVAQEPEHSVPSIVQLNVLGPEPADLARELAECFGALGVRMGELRSHRHRMDGELLFGSTIMLVVDEQAPADVCEQLCRAMAAIGLQADAEEVFIGIE